MDKMKTRQINFKPPTTPLMLPPKAKVIYRNKINVLRKPPQVKLQVPRQLYQNRQIPAVREVKQTILLPKKNDAIPRPKTHVLHGQVIPKDAKRLPRNIAQSFRNPLTDSYVHRLLSLRNIGTGRILIMIAAGPSVNEVDFTPIKNHKFIDTMCINKPHPQVWPATYWAFCDHTQYLRNEEKWREYSTGLIINSPNVTARKANQILIKVRHGKGFSQNIADGYHIGRSSTYANMQTALFMNYDKIYVFGVDMCEVNGQLHYYGNNPDVAPDNRKGRFTHEADNYLHAAQALSPEIRGKFIFCSTYCPWKFMEFFTRLDQKIAIEEILKVANAKIDGGGEKNG
jgi:hypothetical protein